VEHFQDILVVQADPESGFQTHGLRTPREKIAFTARPKIHSHSQIVWYGGSIFCLPHRPNFSDILDLCLHWVSLVRVWDYSFINFHKKVPPIRLFPLYFYSFLNFHIFFFMLILLFTRARARINLLCNYHSKVFSELPY